MSPDSLQLSDLVDFLVFRKTVPTRNPFSKLTHSFPEQTHIYFSEDRVTLNDSCHAGQSGTTRWSNLLLAELWFLLLLAGWDPVAAKTEAGVGGLLSVLNLLSPPLSPFLLFWTSSVK